MALGDDGPAEGPPAWIRRLFRREWVADYDQLEQTTMPDRPAGGSGAAMLIAGAGVFGLIALGLLAAR